MREEEGFSGAFKDEEGGLERAQGFSLERKLRVLPVYIALL